MAAVFRLAGLGYPTEEYFDEVYHAKTALQYLKGETPTEWVHPPTAKLLIAIGVQLFGYHPWAWRLAPALAGTALAGVFLLLARRVLRSERAAVLATTLLLCDGVFLVQSRVAMTNVFAVLFQLLAALLVVRAAAARRLGLGAMVAAGLALGLALSTRWTSIFAAGFLGLVFLALRVRRRREPPDEPAVRPAGSIAREAALVVLAFALVPGGPLPAELRALDAAGASCDRARVVGAGRRRRARAARHLELPRQPAGDAHLLQPVVDVAVPVPAHLVLLVGRRRCRAGHHRARQPRDLVGGAAGGRLGPAQRLALARRASPLRRQRLLHAVPALGALAAHAQLQPLPVRGDPLRLPRARPAARSRLGRPQAPARPRLRRDRGRSLLRLPAAPDGDAGRRPALGRSGSSRAVRGSGPGSEAGSERDAAPRAGSCALPGATRYEPRER